MVEAEKPRRVKYRPHPDAERAKRGDKIKAIPLDFKIIKEDWSIYDLEDGTRIRVKISVTSCDKALNSKTGELMHNEDGSPLYGIEMGVQINYEYSEDVLQTKEGGG